VEQALANELSAAEDTSHPMRYRLHKSSPRLATTKLIVETRDGGVARLVSVNDQPLAASAAQKEQARLDSLFNDPSRQRHRKQSEDADAARVLKVLRALPHAFLYQFAGEEPGPGGASDPVAKFHFRPNPVFAPPDLETEVLTEMSGEILIDAPRKRVTHLEGKLQQDVDFGWGILGRLNKGGSIVIEQADVGGQWRIVHFKMQMSGRVVFKTKVFDTVEDESEFVAVPQGLSYQKGIEMLREAKDAPQGH